MKANAIRKILSIVYLIFWSILIFGMSAKTGEESAGLSLKLSEFVYKILPIKTILSIETLHFFIRKCAHFTEYGILALLTVNMLNAFIADNKKMNTTNTYEHKILAIIVIIFVVMYALSDEYHQSFVSGRYPSMGDVIIDSAGGAFFLTMYLIIKHRKSLIDNV